MTPHITAKKEDIAKVVIMPGDPLRAKLMAEKYLENPKQINKVRGMLGYTGKFKNKEITIMGHGMGCGSMGIYAHELFAKNFYDVDLIIRIGSCASYDKKIKINNLFLVNEAYGDTLLDHLIGLKLNSRILKASSSVLKLAQEIATKKKLEYFKGRALTSDAFYKHESFEEIKKRTGIKVAEMEAFALYACAKKNRKKALALLTIVHSNVTKETTDATNRERNLVDMMQWALDIAYEHK